MFTVNQPGPGMKPISQRRQWSTLEKGEGVQSYGYGITWVAHQLYLDNPNAPTDFWHNNRDADSASFYVDTWAFILRNIRDEEPRNGWETRPPDLKGWEVEIFEWDDDFGLWEERDTEKFLDFDALPELIKRWTGVILSAKVTV